MARRGSKRSRRTSKRKARAAKRKAGKGAYSKKSRASIKKKAKQTKAKASRQHSARRSRSRSKKKAEVAQAIKDVVKVEAIKPGRYTLIGRKIAERVRKQISIKQTKIIPKSPAIIPQQLSKAKRVPFILAGLIIGAYMLFKKRRKGGKK